MGREDSGEAGRMPEASAVWPTRAVRLEKPLARSIRFRRVRRRSPLPPPGIAGYRSGILIECAVYPANPPRSLAGYSGRVGKKSVIAPSEQEVVSELRFGMAGALAEWAANLPST